VPTKEDVSEVILDIVMNYATPVKEFNGGQQKAEPFASLQFIHLNWNKGRKVGPVER
jgi:hypothetical protein